MGSYWKNVEKEVGRLLGGVRLGATGTDSADVHTDKFCIQVKYKKSFPLWLSHAVANAKRNADKHSLAGAVILKERGTSWDDAMVMVDMRTFKHLLDGRFADG